MSVATDGGGIWVAVSYGGDIMRSTDDGKNWALVEAPDAPEAADANQLWSVATDGAGRWLAVRDTGTHRLLVSSDDGASWALSDALPGSSNWRSIAYGDDVWIATATSGTTRVARSLDGGTTWSSVRSSGQFQSVATDGNGVWIAVDYFASMSPNPVIRSDDDGATWTTVVSDAPALGLGRLLSVAADGSGGWVAVGETGTNQIVRSTDDGITWVVPDTPPTGFSLNSVAHHDGVWVAVAKFVSPSSPLRVIRSTDVGDTWTAVAQVDGVPGANTWTSIAHGGGVWVAVSDGGTGRAMRSVDPLLPPVVDATSATLMPVLDDGGNPEVAPGSAIWRTSDGRRVPLVASTPTSRQVRYETEGVTVTLTGAATIGASGGLVAGQTGEILCEVCTRLATGSVVEVWLFSSPRLVAAHRAEDEACHLFAIPIGAPLDGGGLIATGPHTLQLAMPTERGVAALDVGITVGGPIPTSVPSGEGRLPFGGALPLFAGLLLAGAVAGHRIMAMNV